MHRTLLSLVLCLVPTLTGLSLPGQRSLESLLVSSDEVLQDVSRIRQLQPRSPIEKGVLGKEEIRAYLMSRIEEEYPREDILAEERFLKKLGLVPPAMDLYSFMLDLLTEQIAGYYDPVKKTLYLADWIPIEMQKPVMAHELTHALQDQHFDLEEYLSPVEENDDKTLARGALVEGEGLLMMLQYTLEPFGKDVRTIGDIVELNRSQMPFIEAQYVVFASAPSYLKETLTFPYAYGAAFLQAYLKNREWADIGLLYEDFPESTEQILHPQKFFENRDRPTSVPMEDLIHSPWKLQYRNVLGEFSWLLILSTYLDEQTAAKAGEGWDGDSAALLDTGAGREAIVLRTVWDSAEDAAEFSEAIRLAFVRRYESESSWTPLSGQEPWDFELSRKGGRVKLSLEAEQVTLVDEDF